MKVIKAYPIELAIKGMQKRAIVSIEVENETDIDFSYWDKKTAKHTQKDLDSGKVICLWVLVRIGFSGLDGFEGVDSLGQVFVRPSSIETDVFQTVNDHGMIDNASSDLIEQVLKGVDKLNEFLSQKSA